MARYQDNFHRQTDLEDWDDDQQSSRALVPYGDDDLAYDDDDEFDDEMLSNRQSVLVIPGAGLPTRTTMRRRKRPVTMQVVLATVMVCIIVTTVFAFGSTNDAQDSTASLFTTLSRAIVLTKQDYVLYRARSGDTLDSIAATYNAQIGGIQYLNHMNATDEIQVGQVYEIPTNPDFCQACKAALPPNISEAGFGLTQTNYYGNCMFCSHGGYINDDANPAHCAPGYLAGGVGPDQAGKGNLSLYALVAPNPGAHWVRGFTFYHDGADISTGILGTPLYAAQAGQIIFSGYDNYGSGFAVKINHCGGLATSYSHLNSQYVHSGQYVKAGDLIGYQGNTGQSFGTHLHFMLWWKNVPIDPICGYTATGLAGDKNDGFYGGCPPSLYPTVWNPQG